MRIDHSDFTRKSGVTPSIYFGIPTYDSRVYTGFSTSLTNTILHLKDNGVASVTKYCKHDAFVDRARNRLIDDFLKTDCTHMMMIDSDQSWEAEKVFKMLQCDKDFIAGAVRQKEEQENYSIRVNTDMNRKCIEKDGLVSTHRIGLAFVLIKREVFEKVKTFNGLKDTLDSGVMFTNHGIHDVSADFQGKETWDWIGEDFDFCKKYIDTGLKIWIYPDINISHFGEYEFKSNFHEYLCKQPKPSALTSIEKMNIAINNLENKQLTGA